jgi:AAA15 family ATPase/GTPase
MHQWKDRMLIGFRFQNFRSFLAEQSFSFSTSSDRTHESTHLIKTGMKAVPRISKAAIVFGPNASGKTNLLIALATFRDLIRFAADPIRTAARLSHRKIAALVRAAF